MTDATSSLAHQVRELEARCLDAERRLAEVRATLLVNLKPGRLEGMTARDALKELLLLLFKEEQPNPESLCLNASSTATS